MLRHVLVILKPAPLLLVATFTGGLGLAFRAGLFGIPILVILVSWFFKYCFLLLDAVVAGAEEPPVLSLEAVNPLSEQRPLAQAFLIVCGAALAHWTGSIAGPFAPPIVGAVLIGALPASIAVLGITSSPIKAASPRALLQLARGLGRDYVWLTLALFFGAAILYGSVRLAPPAATFVLAQLTLLASFALIGGAVLENRHSLGLDTLTRAERLAARQRRERDGERGAMLDRSYAQLRLGRSLDAWQEIERWIATHSDAQVVGGAGAGVEDPLGEYGILLEATSKWDDPRIADRLARDLLSQLLARGDNGRALEVAERRLVSNPAFAPAPADAVRLTELAGYAGKRALQQRLAAARPA
jgi:hypothetical protein